MSLVGAESAREAELAFKQLLTEADPVVNGGSSWPAVKRAVRGNACNN